MTWVDTFRTSLDAMRSHRMRSALTVLGILVLIGFALLSARVRAFWARVRQGLAILRDRRRYFREVFLVQFGAWLLRFTAFWFLLDAFHVGGAVRPAGWAGPVDAAAVRAWRDLLDAPVSVA